MPTPAQMIADEPRPTPYVGGVQPVLNRLNPSPPATARARLNRLNPSACARINRVNLSRATGRARVSTVSIRIAATGSRARLNRLNLSPIEPGAHAAIASTRLLR